MFQNPAGLATIPKAGAQFTNYRQLITDYTILGLAVPRSWGGLSIGYVSAVTDMAPKTTLADNGSVVSTGESFHYVGHGLVAGVASSVAPGIAVGGSVRWIRESMDGYQATGQGLDMGAVWQSRWLASRALSWGLVVRNAVRPRLVWNTPSRASATIPQQVQLGMRVSPIPEWVFTADVRRTEGYSPVMAVGSEYWALPVLALRLGWQPTRLSVGLGAWISASMQVNGSLETPLNNTGNVADLDVFRISIATVF